MAVTTKLKQDIELKTNPPETFITVFGSLDGSNNPVLKILDSKGVVTVVGELPKEITDDITVLKSTKADSALTPNALNGTTVSVGPNKYYTYEATGACTITLEGWDATKLESSSIDLTVAPEATVTFSPVVDLKGDKLEAGASYQCMLNHTSKGFVLVAIKRVQA